MCTISSFLLLASKHPLKRAISIRVIQLSAHRLLELLQKSELSSSMLIIELHSN